jgi:hypothetical protein
MGRTGHNLFFSNREWKCCDGANWPSAEPASILRETFFNAFLKLLDVGRVDNPRRYVNNPARWNYRLVALG